MNDRYNALACEAEAYRRANAAAAEIALLRAEIERLHKRPTASVHPCVWTENEDGTCETACGDAFDGSPVEHDFKFCCYCGGEMIFKEFSETGGAA